MRGEVNLGLAVDVERKDGSRSLLVPVVRDAAGGGFDAFRAAYDDLVGRTRAGQVKPDELRGASITLTNPGGLGTIASVPRLMAGPGDHRRDRLHRVPARAWASAHPDTLSGLGIEKVMTMTSTYDHRVIQGAESGAFLGEIDKLLGGADGFYEDVRASLGLAARRRPPRRRRPPPPFPSPPPPRRPEASRSSATRRSWPASPPRCRWSRPTAATATWPPSSTRSARRPRATRR